MTPKLTEIQVETEAFDQEFLASWDRNLPGGSGQVDPPNQYGITGDAGAGYLTVPYALAEMDHRAWWTRIFSVSRPVSKTLKMRTEVSGDPFGADVVLFEVPGTGDAHRTHWSRMLNTAVSPEFDRLTNLITAQPPAASRQEEFLRSCIEKLHEYRPGEFIPNDSEGEGVLGYDEMTWIGRLT